MKKQILYYILIVVSLLAFTYCLFYNKQYTFVPNLYLLPFFYLLYIFLIKNTFRKGFTMAYSIMQFIIFARYIVIPILWATTSRYTDFELAGTDLTGAVYMMIYELISVGLVISHCYKGNLQKNEFELTKTNTLSNSNNIFTYIIILICSFGFLRYEQIRNRLFNFSVKTAEDFGLKAGETMADYYGNAVPGIITVFSTIGVLLIFCLVAQVIRRTIKNKIFCFILIMLSCMGYISCVWTSGFTVSRWNMLIGLMVSVTLLLDFYPKYRKAIANTAIVLIIAVILVGSTLKLLSFGRSSKVSLSETVTYYFDAGLFDEYFSGINPVANGIELRKRQYNFIDYRQGIVDCFQTVPYAMKVFGLTKLNVTEKKYHNLTNRPEIIMPNCSVSYYSFGWIGSNVYSCLFVFLAFYFEKRMMMIDNLQIKLLHVVIVFWCSLFMALNVSIISSNIVPPIIGIMLLGLGQRLKKTRLTFNLKSI